MADSPVKTGLFSGLQGQLEIADQHLRQVLADRQIFGVL
jgi:hypothetical protein